MCKIMIPVACSNRHAHLTQENIEQLFGIGYKLTFLRDIKQHDDFVSGEVIGVAGPGGILKGVRVMGPARDIAQVEMSVTDARHIGAEIKVRRSGDVAGTGGVRLIGAAGDCRLEEGVIIPARHIHVNPDEARKLGIADGRIVSAKTSGARGVIFHNIVVRTDPLFVMELHLDTDEFNAAGLKKGDYAELIL